MIWVDYLMIAVLALSAALGFWRGFVKEALALTTWLVAIWVAWRFSWVMEAALAGWSAPGEVKLWASRALVFILALVVGGVITWLISTLIKRSGLSSTDRLLGAVFGAGRGVVLLGVAVIALEYLGLEQNPWWRESRLSPYGEKVASGLKYYAALGNTYVQDLADADQTRPD